MGQRRWPGVFLVMVLLGLTPACKSESAPDEPVAAAATTTTQADPTRDDRTPDQLAADSAAATAAILVLDDLPAGWTAEPRNDEVDDDGPALEDEMAACLGVDKALFADSPVEVESDTFTLEGAEVEADVSVLPTTAYADEVFAIIMKPEASGCFQSAVQTSLDFALAHPAPGEELPADVVFGEITFGELSFAAVGEDSRAFRISVPITAGEVTAALYFDILFLRVGRALSTISFLDVEVPFDQALATELATTVASRLPTA